MAALMESASMFAAKDFQSDRKTSDKLLTSSSGTGLAHGRLATTLLFVLGIFATSSFDRHMCWRTGRRPRGARQRKIESSLRGKPPLDERSFCEVKNN